jgi:hypothetical protein
MVDPPDEGPTQEELRRRRKSISEDQAKRRASVSKHHQNGSGSGSLSKRSLDDLKKDAKKKSPGDSAVSDEEGPALSSEKGGPILTDRQKQMVKNINEGVPKLQKVLAYIHPVRNAHAIIVSRDVKRFELHRMGEGVLRHFADHFVL